MKVEVLLRDKHGIEGVHSYEIESEFEDSTVFMWEDGNYACDCNRSIFLYGTDFEDAQCSNGKIQVVSLKIDGEERYSELSLTAEPSGLSTEP